MVLGKIDEFCTCTQKLITFLLPLPPSPPFFKMCAIFYLQNIKEQN